MLTEGRWLFELRIQHNLSLTETSNYLDISICLMSQMESGSILLPEDHIKKIATLFGVSKKYVADYQVLDKSLIRIKTILRKMRKEEKHHILILPRSSKSTVILEPFSRYFHTICAN
ncbi:MAG: helix-turn-helix transcriptional regulator [Candidatus Margulisbacteria bacterium]|nr:helix-turn-helix transcriptional regulator [Candidatus Margulisiibacteriota bacterium]